MTIENPSNPEDEMPDWLKKLQGDPNSQKDGDDSTSADPKTEGAVQPGDSPSRVSEEAQEAPDWLEVIRRGASKIAQSQPSQTTDEKISEDPEWLRSIRKQHAIDSGSLDSDQEAASSSNLDDLLQSIRSKNGTQSAEGKDWLTGLAEKAPHEKPDTLYEISDQDSSPPELDWLSGISDQVQSQQGEESPDWLESIGGESELKEEKPQENWLDQLTEGQIQPEESEIPGSLNDIISQAEDFPHESAFTESGLLWSGADQEEEQATSESPDTGEEQASWLSDISIDEDAQTKEDTPKEAAPSNKALIGEELNLGGTELPDWISEKDQEQAITSSSETDSVSEGLDLAPAELPSWLQAMRPKKTAPPISRPPSTEGEKVTIGPLAGLDGALPAEPEVVHFGDRAPQQSNMVNITEIQHAHIDLLRVMVEQEDQPLPVSKRTVALPQQIMRWAITAVLFLGVFVPVFFGSTNTPLPAPLETVIATRDIIEALPPGTPVLVAFEYQPGFSAEMQAAAVAVLDHMLIKGVLPVFISTQPAGPGLVEQLLQSNLSEHPYISQEQYPNLGFISGGSAAMVNFATDPRGTMPLPQEDGHSGWDQTPLSSIQQITDFGLLLVITEDPDTARSWIEQVQPSLVDSDNPANNTPLVMVVSAQAGPLIYPYFQTSPRQLSGLITGLSGGASYESSLRTKVARQYWDGFTWGINITVLIMSFGGLINIGRRWIKKK